jgi:hypothetical protein
MQLTIHTFLTQDGRLVESRTTSAGVIYASLAPTEFSAGTVAVEEGREVA